MVYTPSYYTNGIHHITAIASDAQKTIDFYCGILGLRLVKQTVNQDDPGTYHLFFGDTDGSPGMDLTFFIFLPSHKGRVGNGQVSKVSFAIPNGALSFWRQRLTQRGISYTTPPKRFGRERITFDDFDGLQLELVETQEEDNVDASHAWISSDILKKYAIRQFYSATLQVQTNTGILPILTGALGYTTIKTDGDTTLLGVTESTRGSLLELSRSQVLTIGMQGTGTVHHIAFRAGDEAEQRTLRDRIEKLGLYPTEVIDRFYFKSVYFRTPAGILFEIATDGPGFTADQTEADLGTSLSLPPFLQPFRNEIMKNLVPLHIKHD